MKTRERGEEGRDRRQEGRHTTQKMEGGSAPGDMCTGGARGSDGKGDRKEGGRQNGGQNERSGTDEERDEETQCVVRNKHQHQR